MEFALPAFRPPEPADEHDARALRQIGEFDCTIWIVSDDANLSDPLPTFAYSTGLYARFLHPEIVVYGLKPDLMHSMINQLRDRVRAGHTFRHGDRIEGLIEGFPVEARTVHPGHYEEHFGWARWFYRSDDFPVLQLVWPTTRGVWPWEPHAPQIIRDRQPLLDSPWPPLQ
ncbi:MAG TPA: DUF4262 domain-containing protein [Phycisphaerales bacterium]|nr:DUF4262 domain-containing protein [Phycisphaerales bacterium]